MKDFAKNDGFRFAIWTFGAILAVQIILRVTRDVTQLRAIFALVALTAVPILLILAWIGWIRTVRPEIPSWRNGLARSALLIPSLQWSSLAGITVLGLANIALGGRHPLDPSVTYAVFMTGDAGLVALVLVVALKRTPRIQTMLACVLMMFVYAPATYS